MGFTVADLIALPKMKEAKVVAGGNGLNHEISGATFIEFPPSICQAQFLTPEQRSFEKKSFLLMSSLFAVADDIEEQIKAIKCFKDGGTSGLVLFHVGFVIKEISQKVLDCCNALDYPLIVVPPSMLFGNVHNILLESLAADQMKTLLYSQSIYDRMTRLMLNAKMPLDIVRALDEIINKKVFFCECNGQCVSSRQEIDSEFSQYIQRSIELKQNLFHNTHENYIIPSLIIGQQLLLAPVCSSSFFYGVLVICNCETLSEMDIIAISQAKNTLGIISFNKIRMNDYNKLMLRDYISDLTNNTFPDESLAITRGLSLGVDITQYRNLAVVDICNFSALSLNHTETQLQDMKAELQRIIANELTPNGEADLVISYSDKNVILFTGDSDQEHNKHRIANICFNIINNVKIRNKFNVVIGVGSMIGNLREIHSSYRNAIATMRVANCFFGPSSCVFFDDVSLYAMLYDQLSHPQTLEASTKLLAPLTDFDKNLKGNLVETMSALLENDLSVAQTAERIFAHKNTILQRKKKIISILGYDPFVLPHRLQFELALALRVLNRENR